MKKFLTELGLTLLVFLLAIYIILELFAIGSEDNFFNSHYRQYFAQYPIIRNLMKLHSDGDAKADYLSQRYPKITLEIDVMDGLTISSQTIDSLVSKMEAATGKQVDVVQSDIIPFQGEVSDSDIDAIVKKYRNFQLPGTASVYLLYMAEHNGDGYQLGLSYHDFGILLFDHAIHNFTQDHADEFNAYVESTALHEFGHQLGLPHNTMPGCLMQAYADSGGWPDQVVTDFCPAEKAEIQSNE